MPEIPGQKQGPFSTRLETVLYNTFITRAVGDHMDAVKTRMHPLFEDVQLGFGTWAWGDRLFWGFGREYGEADIKQAFEAALAGGIRFFDTAEGYGQGRSETILGSLISQNELPLKIATKFMPYPWRLRRQSLLKALQKSLQRLGRPKVELYQIHFPIPPITIETWMEAMVDAKQNDWIEAAGVSNFDRAQTQRAYDALARHGMHLVSNQVEYHLLDRQIEKNGLLKQCSDLGVVLVAYSPLAQGLLTGKYTPDQPPVGVRGGRVSRKYLAQIQPLLSTMRKIGADHAGKTTAQVALNWVICKGAVPIPGIKRASQTEDNLGALGWHLTGDEVATLDEASDRVLAEG
jgi:aryl-alcohol dehydrogenase-like predicted oxidoreductase